MVYRGAVSFILTARAEGELLDNDQVVLMMRLSLCMIWLSVFQHIAIADPHTPLHLRFEKEKEEDVGAPMQDWFHSFFVRDEDEEEVGLLSK